MSGTIAKKLLAHEDIIPMNSWHRRSLRIFWQKKVIAYFRDQYLNPQAHNEEKTDSNVDYNQRACELLTIIAKAKTIISGISLPSCSNDVLALFLSDYIYFDSPSPDNLNNLEIAAKKILLTKISSPQKDKILPFYLIKHYQHGGTVQAMIAGANWNDRIKAIPASMNDG